RTSQQLHIKTDGIIVTFLNVEYESILVLRAGKTGDNGMNKNRSCILQCPILLCLKDINSILVFRMLKPKLFSFSSLWKPKNVHSLEYLRYLHGVLIKNGVVTDQNRNLLVEVLRSIAEILIWGDQNDASVFE
uniref:FPL domain-containing protein n=1 Tax=Romanomermis culicivorax TaxID=13658 RepID=A0A915HKK9_ROMCU